MTVVMILFLWDSRYMHRVERHENKGETSKWKESIGTNKINSRERKRKFMTSRAAKVIAEED
jgi:hypothetical protein